MNATDVSQSLNGKVAPVDLATKASGDVMDVYHGREFCRINATTSSALLRVAAATLVQQNCDMPQPQKTIAAWIEEMLKKHGISPSAWAKKAKVGRDSIYRARDSNYEFTTSTSTLTKLAAALDEPVPAGATPPGLNAEALGEVVTEIVQVLAPGTQIEPEALRLVSEALRDVLAALAADPDAAADPARSRSVARALVRRHAH